MLDDISLMKTACLIDGQWSSADAGQTFPVINPATGGMIAKVPDCGTDETRRAIDAAIRAFPEWRAKPAKERSGILRRWFDLIASNGEDLARLMTGEQGKPLAEARGEIAYGASFVEWFAEEAKRVYGDVIPAPANDRRYIVIRQPVGVVAAITPWNFFMTARFAHLPFEFLELVSRRIINEVKGISRVAYDISGKPPATIEWE